MLEILLSKEQQMLYDKGEIALGVRGDTLQKVRVININGKMCLVVATSTPYTKVNPYTAESTALNLTNEETKEAMQKGSVDVFRSSGAKDGERTLTREEQVKQGCARVISVVASLKDGHKGDNASDFEWHIIKDTCNRYEEIK